MSKKTYIKPEVKEIRSSSLAWEECLGSGDAWDCNPGPEGGNFCCPPGITVLNGDEGSPWNAYHCCG